MKPVLNSTRAIGVCLVLVTLAAAAASRAGSLPLQDARPVAECFPERPKPGETVEIRYHAAHKRSKFSPNEEVFAAVTVVSQEHSSSKEQHLMNPDKNDLVARIVLPGDAAFLTAYFLTLSSDSSDVTPLQVAVYTADGRPTRNAMASSMGPTNFLERAEAELSLYPDNLAAYRDKWFFLSALNAPEAGTTVAADMAKLRTLQEDSPGLLYAMSYGHWVLKEEPEGRNVLKRMLVRYPLHPLTGAAVTSYFYQAMVNHVNPDVQADMDKAIEETAARVPRSSAARAWINVWPRRPCPADLSIRICEAWILAEDTNPRAYETLAATLNERERDLERAAGEIERALELTLSGQYRLWYDPFGKGTDFYLGVLYHAAADIRFKLGDAVRSLAYLQAARSAPGALPKTLFLEGEVWSALGNLQAAERAYAEAWSKGVTGARDKLRGIYEARRRPGASGDFESWLQGLATPKPASSPGMPGSKPAPVFAARDLEGRAVDFSGLKGKIVVLNFWFVGCGPCKAEIPDLNRLVSRYPEAVFIALSLTEPETTKRFLEDNPFHYRIIASAADIANAYGVKVYPTHIIIDQSGDIHHQRFGGGPSIYDELAPVLDRLLDKS